MALLELFGKRKPQSNRKEGVRFWAVVFINGSFFLLSGAYFFMKGEEKSKMNEKRLLNSEELDVVAGRQKCRICLYPALKRRIIGHSKFSIFNFQFSISYTTASTIVLFPTLTS